MGEKNYIELLTLFLKAIEDDLSYKEGKNEITYILIDEIDAHLHPELVRKLINNIVEIFTKVESKYYIIISTHSEYILSDVPIQNVISLDDMSDDSGIKNETFAKNIGDVAIDNMLIQNVMGEYAVTRIREITNLIGNDSITKEQLLKYEKIISLIGDPIIRKMIKKNLPMVSYDD